MKTIKQDLSAIVERLDEQLKNAEPGASEQEIKAINSYNRANEQAQLLIKQAIDWLDFAERVLK